jgi:hypothetical protein
MLIAICRLYDSYSDANRVVLMLEAAGLPHSETSLISNNSDTWYSATKTANVVPIRKDEAPSQAQADGKVEGATQEQSMSYYDSDPGELPAGCRLAPGSTGFARPYAARL